MPWATRFLSEACRAKFSHAAPVSEEWFTFSLPLYSKVFFEITTINVAARTHQSLLKSTRREKRVSNSGVSRMAYMNLQGWPLNEDGAQRAASKRVISSSSEIASPERALGE